jgi:hypothetical protein
MKNEGWIMMCQWIQEDRKHELKRVRKISQGLVRLRRSWPV